MDKHNTSAGEQVKLSSCMWLGGADCMITTLNNIVTGGGLTYATLRPYAERLKDRLSEQFEPGTAMTTTEE